MDNHITSFRTTSKCVFGRIKCLGMKGLEVGQPWYKPMLAYTESDPTDKKRSPVTAPSASEIDLAWFACEKWFLLTFHWCALLRHLRKKKIKGENSPVFPCDLHPKLHLCALFLQMENLLVHLFQIKNSEKAKKNVAYIIFHRLKCSQNKMITVFIIIAWVVYFAVCSFAFVTREQFFHVASRSYLSPVFRRGMSDFLLCWLTFFGN